MARARPWLASSAALAGAPLAYAIVRVAQHRISREPDPAGVMWYEHSPAVTRWTVGAFVVAMLWLAMLGLGRRAPDRLPNAIATLAIASACALAVQLVVAP